MARQTLNRCASSGALQTLTIAAIIGAAASSATGQDDAAPPHVRSGNPVIVAEVRDATVRSATFRYLIETIDATDGLVYIEEGKCGHSVRACLLMSVTSAGPFRVLRVLLSNTKADCGLMASIGHELQHASEALSSRRVRSSPAIHSFFEHGGLSVNGTFETRAATKTGLDVGAQCEQAERSIRSATPGSSMAR
jgi:hypothetical protein